MNKLFRKATSMMMILTVIVGSSALSYASDSKTIEVNGYITESSKLSKDEKAITKAQFSVSNVINEFDKSELVGTLEDYFIEDLDYAFVVNQSSKVQLVDKGGVVFEVVKLIKDPDGSYDSGTRDPMQITGPVEISIEDESGASVKKVIDFAEIGNYGTDFPAYLPGAAVTLSEPGDYIATFRYDSMNGSSEAYIKVVASNLVETDKKKVPVKTPKVSDVKSIKALPTNSKVMIDGVEKSFEAYNIDGSNYFKLRDIAMVINGSKKQFEVEWNNEKQSINLISNKAYTPVNSEMKIGDGKEKNGVLNTSKIYKDDVELNLLAYNINGNNFFKLRDVADAFNVEVTWDDSTKTIKVDTSK